MVISFKGHARRRVLSKVRCSINSLCPFDRMVHRYPLGGSRSNNNLTIPPRDGQPTEKVHNLVCTVTMAVPQEKKATSTF